MSVQRGQGQFGGNLDPQNLSGTVRAGLFTSTLAGAPGARLARSRAAPLSRRWLGTRWNGGQGYVRTHAGVNSPEALDVAGAAPLKRNRSRSLGQFRGLPYMSQTPSPGGE